MANKKLRELRLSAGLNQAQLARLIGISKQAYGRIESGGCIGSVPTIRRLQKALHLSDSKTWRLLK